jgi:uncharacterized membrane protein
LLGASTRLWTRRQYGFAGLAGGTVFFCLSLTPSLLPRGYLFQGLISGLLAAIGYGLGALAATQYSYLPSPISFLVDKERARERPGPV